MPTRQGLAHCNNCHQPIRWAITQAGRRLAVNPDPHPEGNTAAYRDHTDTWRSRRITEERPLLAHERQFMPHAATCLHSGRNLTPHPPPPRRHLPRCTPPHTKAQTMTTSSRPT